jgi:hypothetical protein
MAAAIMVLPYAAANVRGGHGEILLPPAAEWTGGPIYYDVANYSLDVGDKIDYSFSASDEVSFSVFYKPVIEGAPTPVLGILHERNVSLGQGVLEVDWAGIYWFSFGNENTKASIIVSYSIDHHESWLAEWGLIAVTIAGIAVAVSVVGATLVISARRKGG